MKTYVKITVVYVAVNIWILLWIFEYCYKWIYIIYNKSFDLCSFVCCIQVINLVLVWLKLLLEYKTEWVSNLGMKNVENEIFVWQDKVSFCYAFWKAEIVKKNWNAKFV